jgi:hypothetical protein
MHVHIIGGPSGYLTDYSPQDLRSIARAAVKGKGKLSAYWLTVHDGAGVSLTCQYVMPDGWAMSIDKPLTVNVAI